jgi:hypothetical protein
MMTINDLPLIAGSASTLIFVTSYMPMLIKAVRTKDLSSYGPTLLVLANFGNVRIRPISSAFRPVQSGDCIPSTWWRPP